LFSVVYLAASAASWSLAQGSPAARVCVFVLMYVRISVCDLEIW